MTLTQRPRGGIEVRAVRRVAALGRSTVTSTACTADLRQRALPRGRGRRRRPPGSRRTAGIWKNSLGMAKSPISTLRNCSREPSARANPNSNAPPNAPHGVHLPKISAARAMKPAEFVMLSSKPDWASIENHAPARPGDEATEDHRLVAGDDDTDADAFRRRAGSRRRIGRAVPTACGTSPATSGRRWRTSRSGSGRR